MSEYKGIKGFQVQTRTEDPAPFAQALADNPYAGSWASGGDLPQANRSMGLFGTYTSAVVAGGYISPPNTSLEADSYNGTSWSEIAELNSAKNESQGFGNSATSGYLIKDTTEFWNGSTWTEVSGDLVTARGLASVTGTSTAAILGGGEAGPPARNLVEQWDGSSWTEVAEINTNREAGSAMSGTSTAAIISVGYTGTANTTNSETWNGSSWTEGSDANLARQRVGYAGSTVPTALIIGGLVGTPSPTTVTGNTESYDGTSWSEVNNLATARRSVASGKAGTGTNALAVGGLTPTVTTATEEWSFSGLDPSTTPAADYADAIIGDFYYNSLTGQFKTVNDGGPPIGSWSSGGNLPQNMINMGAFGGRDSVTTGGGSTAPARVGDSFQYDGASWSEIAELNTVRDQSAGLGTQNSGLVAGGQAPSVVGNTENWNGSSWTEVADVSPVRTGAGTAGVYTAGLVFGGNAPPLTASTMTWNGSSWTEVADLNSARNRFMGQSVGTQTAALAVEGEGVNGTESWNGSAWTEVADLNTARHLGGGSGLNTSAIVSSGRTGAPGYNPNAACESWDGSSWTEVADVSSARAYGSSAGTAGGNPNTSSILFGGATTSSTANTTATEEWDAADFQIKAVTQS